MGKGVYMTVLNLDSASHVSTYWNRNCIYADGQRGSYLRIFQDAQYPPMGVVGSPPQYIEANGETTPCIWEQSRFDFVFDNALPGNAWVGINIQTGINPVTLTGQSGPIWVDVTSTGSLNPWGGQAGIGILRPNQNPPPYYQHSGATWMQWMIEQNPTFLGRQLNMVSLPASHDAGMSSAGQCTTWANARVTQTQTVNVKGQLNYGVRYFDLRPALWNINNPSTFYTGHFTSALDGQGCLGENLSDLLGDVASFINSNQQEIVILKFSHYSDNDANAFPLNVQQRMIGLIKERLQNNMLTALVGEKVGLMAVGQIIADGRRVICVFDDLDSSLYDPANGILRFGSVNLDTPPTVVPVSNTNLDVYDSYTGTENSVFMMADQLAKYTRFWQARRSNGELFLLSYTLTLSDLSSTPVSGLSILNLAQKANEPWLWQYATGMYPVNRPGRTVLPPNLVYVDGVDGTTPLTSAIYFNQQVPNPLMMGEVAIRSSAFRNLSLRCSRGANANCQWGIGPWERFELIAAKNPGQYYLKSLELDLYLTLNPQGASSQNDQGFGVAGWASEQTNDSLLQIDSVGNGQYTIGSAQYQNLYLRMDGSGVTQPGQNGVGIANCQSRQGAWERMYIVGV